MPFTKQNQLARNPGTLPANGQLQIRVATEYKTKWKAAAKKSGAKSVAQWAIDRLNEAAKK